MRELISDLKYSRSQAKNERKSDPESKINEELLLRSLAEIEFDECLDQVEAHHRHPADHGETGEVPEVSENNTGDLTTV